MFSSSSQQNQETNFTRSLARTSFVQVESPTESGWSICDHVNTPPHTSNFARRLLCQYPPQPCQIKRPEKSFLQRQLPLYSPCISLAIQPRRLAKKKASPKTFQNRQSPSNSDAPKSIKMTPLSKQF